MAHSNSTRFSLSFLSLLLGFILVFRTHIIITLNLFDMPLLGPQIDMYMLETWQELDFNFLCHIVHILNTIGSFIRYIVKSVVDFIIC